MALRIVMVEFRDDANADDIEEFRQWLLDLASNIPYLKNMWCGRNEASDSEEHLNDNAPNVINPHFSSVWEFEDLKSIGSFLSEPFHKEMAASKFKNIVKIRYVANITDS